MSLTLHLALEVFKPLGLVVNLIQDKIADTCLLLITSAVCLCNSEWVKDTFTFCYKMSRN